MRLTSRHRSGTRRAALAALLALAAAGLPVLPARCEPTPTTVLRIALGGYDPVSYFLPDGPQAGSPRFEAQWGGRVWRFASEADRAAFQRDPTVYAPRLGGFDAAGILDGRLVEADPTIFALVGDRLYLFRDAGRRARFLADPALAATAERIWPGLGRLLDEPATAGPG